MWRLMNFCLEQYSDLMKGIKMAVCRKFVLFMTNVTPNNQKRKYHGHHRCYHGHSIIILFQ